MEHPEYKGIICVEITKKESDSVSIEILYFVPSDTRIKVFIDRGERIEEISLQNRIHDYASRQRGVQVYNLSDIGLSSARLKKLKDAGLESFLRKAP